MIKPKNDSPKNVEISKINWKENHENLDTEEIDGFTEAEDIKRSNDAAMIQEFKYLNDENLDKIMNETFNNVNQELIAGNVYKDTETKKAQDHFERSVCYESSFLIENSDKNSEISVKNRSKTQILNR